MRNLFKYTFLSLAFVLNALAQSPSENAGGASVLFLRTDVSARVAGLGGTFVAVANDENALFYNPAGLAHLNLGSVAANHTRWFEDIEINNLTLGYNLDRKLGIALAVSNLSMPEIQGKDAFGLPTSKIDVSSNIIHLGLGYKIHPSLFLGVGLKYFQDNLDTFSASGVALDAGFYMNTVVSGLSVGASVQNIGGSIQYDTQKEKIPFTIRAGISYRMGTTGFRASVDGVKTLDSDVAIATSLEYTLMRILSLRFGNQLRRDRDFTPGFGAGINIKNKYVVDYTYSEFESLGETHRVGLTFRFDIGLRKARRTSPGQVYKVTRSQAPKNVSTEINDDKLIIRWSKVYAAVYNVYVKSAADAPWKKVNKTLLRDNFLETKKPKTSKAFYVCVTSIVNKMESDFSQEVKVENK